MFKDMDDFDMSDLDSRRLSVIDDFMVARSDGRRQASPHVYDSPSFTTYVLPLLPGVDPESVVKAEADLALALRVEADRVRLSVDYSRGAVIAQVVKDDREPLWFDSDKVQAALAGLDHDERPFEVLLGLDAFGEPVRADFASRDTPHLLVCGNSGSGKSSTIHSILAQIVMSTSPEQARLFIIDGKRVTAAWYKDIPHLWRPSVTDLDEAPAALAAIVEEINLRLSWFEAAKPMVHDIDGWNTHLPEGFTGPLPRLFVVIDEASMLASPDEAPAALAEAYAKHVGRIAAQGRAAGVYLVLATQRPSVRNLGANMVGQMSQRVVHRLSKLAESTMALNARSDDDAALRLARGGDALYTDGMSTTRYTPVYIPEDDGTGHFGVRDAIAKAEVL